MQTFKKAKDIASTDKLFFIDGLSSVKDAVILMKSKNLKALIIRKRNDEDAHGIVTIFDIIKGVVILDKTFEEVSVYEIMTKPVFSIPSQLNVKYVPRLMLNHNIKIAPVEENGEMIGLIDYSQCIFTSLEDIGV